MKEQVAGSKKGRGATVSPANRFSPAVSAPVDDGWGTLEDTMEEAAGSIPTVDLPDKTARLITTNSSPDIPFDQSINPYKGCEHGCVYCFARPTHAYLDLSPGLDFETKIFYKTDVEGRLAKELSRRSYRCATIAMGTNTDPYQPLERKHRITRDILAFLLRHKHPVSIVTKSKLVLRDRDLLEKLARLQLTHVHVSITTVSNELKTKLEPRTAGPAARLRVVERLAQSGVPVGVMAAPIIPFINDHEIEEIVARSAAAGAASIGYILVRLPLEVGEIFSDWLQTHFPDRRERVLNAIRQARGGKLYRSEWGKRMVGEGAIAKLIGDRFSQAARKHGLEGAKLPALRTDLFVPPQPQSSARNGQLNLF